MELGFLAAVLLALAVAGALQVIRGRTDLRRAHRVLSQGLWGMLLTAALLFAGLTAWVLAAGPGDLLGFFGATAAPAGPDGALDRVRGPAARRPGYNPSFLYDLDSGRTVHARFGLVSYFSVYRQDGHAGAIFGGRPAGGLAGVRRAGLRVARHRSPAGPRPPRRHARCGPRSPSATPRAASPSRPTAAGSPPMSGRGA